MVAWLEGCFKEQCRSNLSACLLTDLFDPLLSSYSSKRASDMNGTATVLLVGGGGGTFTSGRRLC